MRCKIDVWQEAYGSVRQTQRLFNSDPSTLDNVWFSDEAIFDPSGRANRPNTRIWRTENPKVIEEKERDSPKLVVWCAISAKGSIGPYFFRDDARRTTTVTGENYLKMLQKFFLPEQRNNASVENCYFQQDGAPAHYARKVRDYLDQFFPDRWIGRRGPLEWAARSPDLTPCDFFLWGFLKSKVYSTRPQNLEELEQKIRASCGLVTQDLLQSVGQECVKRWLKCLEIGGSHLEV